MVSVLGSCALGTLRGAAWGQETVAQDPAEQDPARQEPPAEEPESVRDEGVADEPVRPAEPGEPPRTVDDDGTTRAEEPFGEEAGDRTEPGLGSYFSTSFALAGANDRASGSETVIVPGTRPPGRPTAPVGPPTTVTRDVEIDENGWLVRPSFLFVHRPSARGGLVLAYEPELEQLEGSSDDSERVSHSAGLNFEHKTSRRTEVHAGASYLDSLDPSRHLGGDSFVLIPGRFEQQRVYGGVSRLLAPSTKLSLNGEWSTAKSNLETDDVPLDLTDLSGTIGLEQGIGRKSHVTFSYGYTDTELDGFEFAEPGGGTAPPDDEVPVGDYSGPVDSFRVTFGHRPTARFSFLLGSGVLREDDSLTGEEDTTWIGLGEVAREGEVLTMRLRYDRSLLALGAGDTLLADGVEDPAFAGTALRDTVADTLSFHLEMFPPGRVRFEQSVWLSRRSVLEGDDVDSFVTASLVELLLNRGNAARLGMFARFDYFDRSSSDLLGESLSRQRFSLGLRVGLTGPQTRVAHRLAVDELRRVLPNGGRL
jgi:hypothetical protein